NLLDGNVTPLDEQDGVTRYSLAEFLRSKNIAAGKLRGVDLITRDERVIRVAPEDARGTIAFAAPKQRHGEMMVYFGPHFAPVAGAMAAPAFAQSGGGTGGGGGSGGGGNHGVVTIKLAPGISKRQTLEVLPSGQVRARRNLGVGNEHATVAMLGSTAVVAYVSSNVHNANGPSAVKCSSVQMSSTGTPTILADQIQLTFSNSDRLGHTALACDPVAQK